MPKLTRGQTRDKMRRLERDVERLEKTVKDQVQIIRKLKAEIVEHNNNLRKAERQEGLKTE